MHEGIRSFGRWGLWALPVWAALLVWGTFEHQPDPETEFDAWSAFVTSDNFLASHLVASILGAVIGSVGIVALLIYLADALPVRRTLWGTISTLAAQLLNTSLFGVAAFAQTAMGRMQKAGEANASTFYDEVYSAPLFGTALVALVCFLAGAILVGSAIAASGRLPRWAGWLYAVAHVTFVLGGLFFFVLQPLSAVLLLIATGAVAWRARASRPRVGAATIPA